MVPNELYKRTENTEYKDGQNTTENSYYSDVPVINTSCPQSEVYDGLSSRVTTPGHTTMKQSDNPLYSSTQELRLNNSYDTIPSRSQGHSPTTGLEAPEPDGYATPQFDEKSNTINHRLSYGLELELSNRQILPVRHQRSLSQGIDPIYTEL